MQGGGTSTYDGRRKMGKNAMVDAAIARLRAPRERPPGGSPRKPITSAYGSHLVSPDEFYARAGIAPRLPATPSIARQATSNATNTSQRTGREGLVVSSGAAQSPSVSSIVKAEPISAPAATSSNMETIKSNLKPVPIPVDYGQAGLTGSRWADTSVVSPATTSHAQSQSVTDAVSISTSGSVTEPLITNKTPQVKPLQSSSKIILRSFDGVKISSGSLQEVLGVVRLVTSLGNDFVNLEILVNNILVLNEALYASDTFVEESGVITFQAYSEKGEAPVWKLICSLPYQSAILISMTNSRLRNVPRPMHDTATVSSQNTVLDKELSTVEAPVTSSVIAKSIATPAEDSSNIAAADSHLLIDFNAEDVTQPYYLSPTIQTLMGLMTDDRSITDFLDRLNQSNEGAFLDRVFSTAGDPPSEGYPPQMLLVARDIVLELYTQSDIFHKLPSDVTETLVVETSEKVLEKALSIWRSQSIEDAQTFQTDATRGALSERHRTVYSPDELLSLRSRASTIEGKLMSDFEKTSTNQQNNISIRTSLSRVSLREKSGRNAPALLPAAAVASNNSSASSTESVKTLSAGIEKSAITTEATGDQKKLVSNVLQSELKSELQDSLDLAYSHKKQWSISSAASYDAKDNIHSTNPFRHESSVAIKSEEPTESLEDQDQKYESTDSELLTKLKGLSLGHNPVESASAPGLVSTTKDEEGNVSILAPSSTATMPAPIVEINNVDLKGNPGLAASMWAQETEKAPTVSRLREPLSIRISRTPTMSSARPHQPEALNPHQRLIPLQPQVPHIHHPPSPYSFAPPNFMPQPNFVPQFTTVLVTDPSTGEVKEVTGVQKAAPPAMPFPGHAPLYQGLPVTPVPVGFQISPNFPNSHRPSKPKGSSPLQGGAPRFSPKTGTRSPLSPTRDENARIQGKRYTGSSPRHG